MQKPKAFLILTLLITTAIFMIANRPPVNKNYDKLWEQVDSLDMLRQPSKAMEIVEEISRKASEDENIPQIIKSQLYRLKLSSEFEEDFMVKAISELKAEVEVAEAPQRQILSSILGELYLKYYQANRYKILNRTPTLNYDDQDIQTWDAGKLMKEARMYYLQSLDNSQKALNVHIKGFEAILEQEKNSSEFRPTLFDFLSHRAIEFLMNDETDQTVASGQFIPDDEKYFKKASSFVKVKFDPQYQNSNTVAVLQVYQQVLKFHLNDKNPKAFLDADLKRLEFVYNKSVIAQKEKVYVKALNELHKNYKFSEESTSISFQLARFYRMQAAKYRPLLSEDHRWENQKALSFCEEAMTLFPKSEGAQNCEILVQEIMEPELSLQIENAIVPGEASLGLLKWKNYKSLYFRLVKMEYKDFNKLSARNSREHIAGELAEMQSMDSWTQELPDEEDFQGHSAEFKVPALDEGFYVLLVSDDANFSTNKIAWAEFWSTELSYISQRLPKGGYKLFVLDRKNGKPKSGVTINVYKRDYNYRQKSYEVEFISTHESDTDGFVELLTDSNIRGGVFIELIQGEDVFVPTQNFFLNAARDRKVKTEEKTFFFTDRAIYRPGQLVYFKAILLEKSGDKYEIKPEVSTKVEFFDVNNQLVSSMDLSTNEYGSTHGSFTIPTGLLNGEMRIKNASGSIYVHVEEYKRPKFAVTFLPVGGSYKLNENISIEGNAKAYAGNMVDGAKVKYRVVRNSYFPKPYYYYRSIWPSSQEMEILAGETVTDAAGNFEVSFEAIPDYGFDQQLNPSFTYTITADITDINGETQSATQNINVGTQALVLDISIPDRVNIENPASFEVFAKNLNGQKQDSKVKLTVHKLTDPKRLIKERLWQIPDTFLLSAEQFRDEFPTREHKNESDPATWEKGEIIFEKEFDLSKDSLLSAREFADWSQGNYMIQMNAEDIFGGKVESQKMFTLFDQDAKRPPVSQYNWFEPIKIKGEPGETALILLGTSAKNVRILYEVQHRDETILRQWIKLSNTQKLIEIPIEEAYRGNFTFQYSFVVDNRIYSASQIIEVPYTNKKLDLAFETMRSDLEPGSDEKWTVTIRNKNGDRMAAEMLASMYDASLDKFVPNTWKFDLYRSYNQMTPWQSGNNFSVSNNSIFDFDPHFFKPYLYREYDHLNWFGLNTYGGFYDRGAMGGMKRNALESSHAPAPVTNMDVEGAALLDEEEVAGTELFAKTGTSPEQENIVTDSPTLQLRRNFNETAFFYPELKTNDSGDVLIEFKLPESLTKWKFMGMAYSEDLMNGFLEQEFTAAKKLMIVPNAPRFFREGDTLNFAAKISNLSDGMVDGQASLAFFDALTMQEVSSEIISAATSQAFQIEQGESKAIKWQIVIPKGFGVLTYRVKATTQNFSDGEEKSIPVLSNRMLVTETMPMPIGGNESKTFTFDKLINTDSPTLDNYRLSLEFASNPAWYAVQALPVISETQYNNAVSLFNAFFANSIAFYLTNNNPEIKRIFQNWKSETPESFLSKLKTNQDLKQVILEQTPWVLEATNQQEQKERIALLFDLNNMQNRLDNSIRLLSQLQKTSGGFCWMNDMRESRYITQMIVQGMGKLQHLGAIPEDDKRIGKMLNRAVRFLDQEMHEDYEDLKKRSPELMDENHLSTHHIQYLYARSFFKSIMINPSHETAYNYYAHQAKQYWTKQNNYLQGMIALALHRNKKKELPALILTSLKDRSLKDDEMGMYWRNEAGYYWYQAPIETQAMMIEVFDEIDDDKLLVEKMKIWLLKQKQTQDWETSRATAEAVYALLSRGSNLLSSNEMVRISLGGQVISIEKMGKVEAGTGYFQTSWEASEIEPEMGEVSVQKTDEGIAWGAMYWQYFEDLDKITSHKTDLSLDQQLFVEKDSKEGRVITPLNNGDELQVGDMVKVRIEIRVDRDMEFVHLRDMRASAFEPVNTLSGYQYSGGLGYYQSTKDASTDFFFDYLRKGTYVFEYQLIASQEGDFSNGITTLQCMYAPEFSSHSKGIRVRVVAQ